MKFKVGDKVKFLNESGGGVVSAIVSPSMVKVAIPEGFEIPVLSSGLVKIEEDIPADSPQHMFREDFDIALQQQGSAPAEETETGMPLLLDRSKGSLPKGVFLAYVPHDQKWLITGLMDIYLVNYSDYDLLYSFFLEKSTEGFTGVDYGSIPTDYMHLIHTADRDGIEDWCKGIVQVLFHKDMCSNVLSPGSSTFRVRPVRFLNETNYKENPLLPGKSILISLIPLLAQTSAAQPEKMAEPGKSAESVIRKGEVVEPVHMIDRHKTSPREAVVDLHIYELVEEHGNLSNAEMLEIQKNYFIGCLESAISNHLTKVTFIHGVGKGALKKELLSVLSQYRQTEYHDASIAGFGYGATVVLIRY